MSPFHSLGTVLPASFGNGGSRLNPLTHLAHELVVGQGLRLTGIGIAAGLIAAFALTRGMVTMLVGVKATDPATFASMAMVFFLIAAMASWLPAWRAASLDPTAALRDA